MRGQLLPVPESSDFTVAVPGFVSTFVAFRSLPTAAMAMLRRHGNSSTVPEFVGAAFIFSGKSKADEDEVIRRTSGGRDSNRQPYPIPASIYANIRNEPTRPFLALTLWNVATARDPSLLAIAQAIAGVFFDNC